MAKYPKNKIIIQTRSGVSVEYRRHKDLEIYQWVIIHNNMILIIDLSHLIAIWTKEV